MKRIAVVAILILAFCGLADAAYLAQHVVSNTPVICNIQGLSDCNMVIESGYSRLFGIPLAEIGVLFYSILFVLAALELMMFDWFLRRVLQVVALGGLLASLYFVFLQAFIIRAFCAYCLISALITLLILFFAKFIEPFTLERENKLLPLKLPPPRLRMPPTP